MDDNIVMSICQEADYCLCPCNTQCKRSKTPNDQQSSENMQGILLLSFSTGGGSNIKFKHTSRPSTELLPLKLSGPKKGEQVP